MPVVELGHVGEPFVPPFTMPHKKVLSDPPTAKVVKSPMVLSVTVTWPLDGEFAVADTPAAALQVLIAAARLVAKVVVLLLVIKVPVKVGAPPVHVVDPLVPAVTVPPLFQEKLPVLFVAVTENADVVVVPFALLVTVVVLVLEVAVTPAATGHALIAAARFVAKVVVLLLV